MANFKIDSQKLANPNVVKISPSGYFDAKAGAAFKTSIDDLVKKGEKLFLFDFKNVPLINSPGMGSLLGVVEDITVEQGGKVAFCNLSKAISDVFKLVGIHGVYPIFENEELGLKSFFNASK